MPQRAFQAHIEPSVKRTRQVIPKNTFETTAMAFITVLSEHILHLK